MPQSDYGLANAGPLQIWYVEPDRKSANLITWTADIQRELALGTVLTLSYVGSKTSSGSAIMGYWNASKPSPDSNLQARRLYRFFHDPLNQNVSVQEAATIQAIISGLISTRAPRFRLTSASRGASRLVFTTPSVRRTESRAARRTARPDRTRAPGAMPAARCFRPAALGGGQFRV